MSYNNLYNTQNYSSNSYNSNNSSNNKPTIGKYSMFYYNTNEL